MSHNPDFQKDEIMTALKRQYEAETQKSGPGIEFRKRRISEAEANASGVPQTRSLADRFESILFAPDYTTEERRAKLLAWAHENRAQIVLLLRKSTPANTGGPT